MKPQIEYLSITIAPNYVYHFAHYESGRKKGKFWYGNTNSYFLYPFEFLRESRSVLHIMQQLCVNKILPMSFDNWIYNNHPKCQFIVNPSNNDIIEIRFASNRYTLDHDIINY